MFMLGALYKRLQVDGLRQLVLAEALARVVKHLVKANIRRHLREAGPGQKNLGSIPVSILCGFIVKSLESVSDLPLHVELQTSLEVDFGFDAAMRSEGAGAGEGRGGEGCEGKAGDRLGAREERA